MANRGLFGILPFIGFSILFSNVAISQDNKLADLFAAVDGPYKLKNEIGIYGFVTQRSGEKVLFQPCTGEAQEISATELEETLNTCSDGGGQSFASICDKYYQVKEFADIALAKDENVFGVGNIYEASGEEIKTEGRTFAEFSEQIKHLQACNNGWTIAYDGNGVIVTQMLSINPNLLKDSVNPIWQ